MTYRGLMTSPNSDLHDRWRNVEIRIVYPVLDNAYDLFRDRLVGELADTVIDLFPQAVMSGQVVWSDADDAA